VDDLGFTMRTFPTFVTRGIPEPPMHAMLLLGALGLIFIGLLGRGARFS
jgi:hypothetical protein